MLSYLTSDQGARAFLVEQVRSRDGEVGAAWLEHFLDAGGAPLHLSRDEAVALELDPRPPKDLARRIKAREPGPYSGVRVSRSLLTPGPLGHYENRYEGDIVCEDTCTSHGTLTVRDFYDLDARSGRVGGRTKSSPAL